MELVNWLSLSFVITRTRLDRPATSFGVKGFTERTALLPYLVALYLEIAGFSRAAGLCLKRCEKKIFEKFAQASGPIPRPDQAPPFILITFS